MTAEDPLLAALADAAQRKQRADHDIRLLLAYAREHVQPRPYRLADLAQAAGMSVSGIRTAYTKADIEQAARLTAALPHCTIRTTGAPLTSWREQAVPPVSQATSP